MRTTEDLRAILFDVIDALGNGTMETDAAKQIINAADQIVKSAALEIKSAQVRMVAEQTGSSVLVERIALAGPMMLESPGVDDRAH